MIADLAEVPGPASALARSISASVRPAPNAPILRKSRRFTPSQNRCRFPQSVNIGDTPLSKTETPPQLPGEEVSQTSIVNRTGRGGNPILAQREVVGWHPVRIFHHRGTENTEEI